MQEFRKYYLTINFFIILNYKMSTNLIIAAWAGPRRNERDELLNLVPFPTTRIGHLQKQISTLSYYQHQLSQITIVIPPHDEPINFTRYLSQLPKRLSGAKLEIFRTQSNIGWSYGSWQAAIQKYQGFDHYLFLEDDYVFVKDDFDKIIIDMWEKRENQDIQYMCNFYHTPDAIVTNGVSSKQVLESRNWRLSNKVGKHDGFFNFISSVKMNGFSKPYHCAPYFGTHVYPGLVICGEGEYLIAPTHAVNPRTLSVDLPDQTPRLYV